VSLAPELIPMELKITIAKLKKNKSPGSDKIPAELIQRVGEILLYVIDKQKKNSVV
jgi:hypothetical protein